MINLDLAIARARVIANDNRYGYSQTRRNEEFEEDCSSGTTDCLNAGGFHFSPHLCTDTMLTPLLAAGFVDVTKSINLITGKGLLPGDVCLRPKTKARGGHVILVLKKDGEEIFQNAGDFDGKRGDSSGKEICIRSYYNSPFTYVLRYPSSCPYAEPTKMYTPRLPFSGNDAFWFQWQLNRIGHKLTLDGQAGPKTWASLGYEITQANNMGHPTGNVAGEVLRAYLKNCPTKA